MGVGLDIVGFVWVFVMFVGVFGFRFMVDCLLWVKQVELVVKGWIGVFLILGFIVYFV